MSPSYIQAISFLHTRSYLHTRCLVSTHNMSLVNTQHASCKHTTRLNSTHKIPRSCTHNMQGNAPVGVGSNPPVQHGILHIDGIGHKALPHDHICRRLRCWHRTRHCLYIYTVHTCLSSTVFAWYMSNQYSVCMHIYPAQCLHTCLSSAVFACMPNQHSVFIHIYPAQCLHACLSSTVSTYMSIQHSVYMHVYPAQCLHACQTSWAMKMLTIFIQSWNIVMTLTQWQMNVTKVKVSINTATAQVFTNCLWCALWSQEVPQMMPMELLYLQWQTTTTFVDESQPTTPQTVHEHCCETRYRGCDTDCMVEEWLISHVQYDWRLTNW